jgi:hypothetical protein
MQDSLYQCGGARDADRNCNFVSIGFRIQICFASKAAANARRQ